MPAALDKALKEHDKWPDLRAMHWQEVAREVLGLGGNIPVSDRRYNVIRLHCNNARRRKDAKDRARPEQQPVDQPDVEMLEQQHPEPLELDDDGELVYRFADRPVLEPEKVEVSIHEDELIELKELRTENKRLSHELESLRKENQQLKSQINARDEWLQKAGEKMLSFGKNGKAGRWTGNLTKYLTQVSCFHVDFHEAWSAGSIMLSGPNFTFCLQVRISRKMRTYQNYKTWLTPFVDWLEKQAHDRPVVVTSSTIRDYLEERNKYKTAESYDRAGKQIVLFVNQYVPDKVHHIKGLGFNLRPDNVNFPEQYLLPVDKWLKDRLAQIYRMTFTGALRREISKILGKYVLFFSGELILLLPVSACALVLHLGCRPSEASYIVKHKSIRKNRYKIKHARHDY